MINISSIIILGRLLQNTVLELFKTLQNTYQDYDQI